MFDAGPFLKEIEADLAAVLDLLDPDAVPLPDVQQVYDAFGAIERRATAGKLLLARRIEETAQLRRDGYQNPADWLAARNGTSTGRARAELGTSKRLKELGETSDALRQGELSSEQAEAISDGASANPAAERELLDKAKRDSVKNLKDEAARKKAAADPDPEARHRRIHRERRLATFGRPDGSWGLAGNGTVDAGAIVNQALDRLIDERFTQARKLGLRESREAYAFDALVELARRALDPTHHWNPTTPSGSGEQPDGRASDTDGPANGQPTNGDTGTLNDGDGDGAAPPQAAPEKKAKRVNPKHLALIRVDLEALIRGQVEGDELCEITGVGPIPVRVARGLLGDSILKLVITKGGDVANVTHLGRGVNTGPFRAPQRDEGPRDGGRPGSGAEEASAASETDRSWPGLERGERPPRRLGKDQDHPAGRHRPGLPPPPSPQDLQGLGARRRNRPPTDGPTRPPTPPQQHRTTRRGRTGTERAGIDERPRPADQ